MQAIREQIASAVNVIVQQTRFSCGTRKVTHISEISGMEGNLIQLQDIFRFEQDGFGADGKVRGAFAPTGHIPDFYQDLIKRGLPVDTTIFGTLTPTGRGA
jgi:pilus assembly protein CpaF